MHKQQSLQTYDVIPNVLNRGFTQDQNTAHSALAMVLSCMDFRLLDDIVVFMNELGYNNNYDQFILAGASLGANQDEYNDWPSTWLKHLDLAIMLHNIKEVIVIDHEKCGAYRLFYPEMKPTEEFHHHVCELLQFREVITKKYPELTIKTYYMFVDGNCEEVTLQKSKEKNELYVDYEKGKQCRDDHVTIEEHQQVKTEEVENQNVEIDQQIEQTIEKLNELTIQVEKSIEEVEEGRN